MIFDAMYSMADMITVKEDWGHSSNIVGVDLCLRASVRHLCMFHHEPAYSDDMIDRVLRETRRYAELVGEGRSLEISSAFDDMVITVKRSGRLCRPSRDQKRDRWRDGADTGSDISSKAW